MKLVPSIDLIADAYKNHYAIPSFCVWNAETIDIVLRTAEKLKAPVMLMSGPGEFGYFSPEQLVSIAKVLGAKYDCTVAYHLDHGDSIEQVAECISAGFTSVMLDFSTRSFGDNVDGMKATVKLARPKGISVEGEIGMVGKNSKDDFEGSEGSSLTDPDQAVQFCKETEIDMVAVSIGNAHGAYTKLPQFDFGLLETLYQRLPVPISLHGGSGTPPADLKRAISLGIAKVNVATEFIEAIKATNIGNWSKPNWLPATTADAMNAGAAVLEKWITLTGSAGKAR